MVKPRRRLLIVEDQAILGMELELDLEAAGYEIVGVAMDRPQAIALAEREAPELALVDVSLADGRTGPQIAAALVRDHGAAVIFLTGQPELVPPGLSGAFGVLEKPCGSRSVEQAVRWGLAQRDGGRPPEPPRELTPAPTLGL